MRIGGASSKYPDLSQVPGAICVYDFVAFTKDLADGALDVKGKGWGMGN